MKSMESLTCFKYPASIWWISWEASFPLSIAEAVWKKVKKPWISSHLSFSITTWNQLDEKIWIAEGALSMLEALINFQEIWDHIELNIAIKINSTYMLSALIP